MTIQRYYSRNVEVRFAGRKKGRGMFATAAIAKGAVIEVAPALLVPAAEADDVLTGFLSHYVFRTDRGPRFVVGLGFTSLYNHGQQANATFYVTTTQVKIKATRAIRKGDEVTVSYGWTAREWSYVGGRVSDE